MNPIYSKRPAAHPVAKLLPHSIVEAKLHIIRSILIPNMNPITSNFFDNIPDQLPDELFESIVKQKNINIERIVSKGHLTPAGQWYDQDWDEWVLLLQGEATIIYETNNETFHLVAGDCLLIPSHTKHRVDWTPQNINTIWLAVHIY